MFLLLFKPVSLVFLLHATKSPGLENSLILGFVLRCPSFDLDHLDLTSFSGRGITEEQNCQITRWKPLFPSTPPWSCRLFKSWSPPSRGHGREDRKDNNIYSKTAPLFLLLKTPHLSIIASEVLLAFDLH